MNGNYENYLIREMTECAPGDTNCADCGQVICACESLSDWLRTVDSEPDVCVPAGSELHANFPVPVLANFGEPDAVARESTERNSEPLREATDSRGGENTFSEWLESRGDSLTIPSSFNQWLNQNGDTI